MARQKNEKKKLIDVRHPHYNTNTTNWRKWRLTYEGGDRFIRQYTYKLGKREDNNDYQQRLNLTYNPAFAKAAVNEVKNAIFQRTSDISREGGSKTYQQAIKGELNGVDLLGSTMNGFIGRKLLPELLSMARVGVYVDMPKLSGPTIRDKGDQHPYLSWYCAEDILSWTYDEDENPNEFKSLLLCDSLIQSENLWELPDYTSKRYRYFWIGDDGLVHAKYFDNDGMQLTSTGVPGDGEQILEIKRIPFVMFEISDSLLNDAANYQIALLNLASTDMAYSIKMNYPFYTEQYDPIGQSPNIRPQPPSQFSTTQTVTNPDGSTTTTHEPTKDIKVGVSTGRRYPKGLDRPQFIHPSAEPITASMAKQEQLKREIRQLIFLSVSNLQPSKSSADSKKQDNQTLENGLSYIGLELEAGERRIAEYWKMYEGNNAATVKYPENYSLISVQDRHDMANNYKELMPNMPSLTYQREIAKQIADTMLGNKVSADILRQIKKEIDDAPVVYGDPKVIEMDVEAGLVGLETASKARGYPDGEVKKAAEDHEKRLERIAIAQAKGGGAAAAVNGQARGVPDLGANPKAGKEEKVAANDPTQDPNPTDKTRGEGK
jgi:hypothetical protein